MPEITIAILLILAASTRGEAAPIYLSNGKEIPAASAALEALSTNNTILKCERVILKANDKGKLDLKNADTNGNWQPIKK